jgi:hypothetical protein
VDGRAIINPSLVGIPVKKQVKNLYLERVVRLRRPGGRDAALEFGLELARRVVSRLPEGGSTIAGKRRVVRPNFLK